MVVTPEFLHARALRYQRLAAKARREAGPDLADPIAPRLLELAEKLERDAVRDEEQARFCSIFGTAQKIAHYAREGGRVLPYGSNPARLVNAAEITTDIAWVANRA
jgi:hypothetical protein